MAARIVDHATHYVERRRVSPWGGGVSGAEAGRAEEVPAVTSHRAVTGFPARAAGGSVLLAARPDRFDPRLHREIRCHADDPGSVPRLSHCGRCSVRRPGWRRSRWCSTSSRYPTMPRCGRWLFYLGCACRSRRYRLQRGCWGSPRAGWRCRHRGAWHIGLQWATRSSMLDLTSIAICNPVWSSARVQAHAR